MPTLSPTSRANALPKCPTGIAGLDDITGGGLPRNRPTIVCGRAGCGKTLLATEFLIQGATQFDEPGVCILFEEQPDELAANVRSLGFDLDALVAENRLAIDYIHLDPAEIAETGAFDLEGLFIRIGLAIDTVGAKRVVLDTIEVLFSSLSDHATLRGELRRLFRYLKEREVTALITCERGDGTLSRHGLEEYVSDCVILLDHRVESQISTRTLRVVKYRGSAHGTNEYPFLIDEDGISVLPVTSTTLTHTATGERISSGVADLDAMLGGRGFYRGSTLLVSGTAGTGKSSLAAHFVRAASERGERSLYVAFEESPQQYLRNMRSVGVDLAPAIDQGLLRFHATRPTAYGLETHLAVLHKLVVQFDPQIVVLDPISNLIDIGTASSASSMLLRLIDFLKERGVTAMFTSLSRSTGREESEIGVSSLVDSWLLLRDSEFNGERNRSLYVLKSRGMAHSNQLREFRLTSRGIQLVDVYVGPGGVLTGTSRLVQEQADREEQQREQERVEQRQRELANQQRALEFQLLMLQAQREANAQALAELDAQGARATNRRAVDTTERTQMRRGGAPADTVANGHGVYPR